MSTRGFPRTGRSGSTGKGGCKGGVAGGLAAGIVRAGVLGALAAIPLSGGALAQDGTRAGAQGGAQSVAQAPMAPAAPSDQETLRPFDIPAQSLAAALTTFGLQSDRQIAVDTTLVSGKTSTAIKGTLPVARALEILLSGTGLGWRVSAGRTLLIEPASPSASPQPAGAVPLPAATGTPVSALAPVTVTGERVERSLRDTAASVAVVDAATLDHRADLTGTNTLTESVANVVTIEPSNHGPVVRGIGGAGSSTGAVAFFAGVRPRLTLQVDGRPTSFNEMIFGDTSLWDVEQVEVFRGPQSTVQGRNAIAGAIVVKTKDPTYTPESRIRVMAGNRDSRQASAMVSGPLVDNELALRLSVDRSVSTSKLAFQPYAGENDPEEYQYTNLRAKLLIEPEKLEGFRGLLTLNHTDYEGPQAEYVKRPFEDNQPYSINVATFNPRTTSGILETTWELNDRLTFENHFALTDLSIRRHSAPGTGNVEIDGREAMLEPRLAFNALDHRLSGFAGYYGLRAKQDEFIDLAGGNRYNDRTQTDAVFGEATLAVTDAVDLTLGARYEIESRERFGGAGRFSVDFDETYKAFLPKVGVAWHATDALTVGTTVSRGYNAGGAGVTFSAPFVDYTYDPEYVWNYEAYARADLLDGQLRLTGNVFYADYRDLQLPFRLAAGSSVIRNAEKAATYGTELGARWLATDTLELFTEIGVLKTEILSYPGSGYESNSLPQAPSFTGSLGAVYRPFDGADIGADLRYSDAYFSDVANTPRGRTDPYWVVNMQAGYTFGSARVFGYVRNLLDTQTELDISPGSTVANDYASMLRSRTFGLGVEMAF